MVEGLVLVIEDEEAIAEVIGSYLTRENYEVVIVHSGSEGLLKARSACPDLIIMDLMLPDLHGEDVCSQLRSESNVPIIMLTAKSGQDDRIRGLSLGADDYVIKPFSPRELVLRVKNVLRRTQNSVKRNRASYLNGELVIDAEMHLVLCRGQIVELTPSEYKLLTILVEFPGRPYTREELLSKAHGTDQRVIDVHIKNLRRKLGDDERQIKLVQTVYGVGYRFGGKLDA